MWCPRAGEENVLKMEPVSPQHKWPGPQSLLLSIKFIERRTDQAKVMAEELSSSGKIVDMQKQGFSSNVSQLLTEGSNLVRRSGKAFPLHILQYSMGPFRDTGFPAPWLRRRWASATLGIGWGRHLLLCLLFLLSLQRWRQGSLWGSNGFPPRLPSLPSWVS